MDKWTRPRIWAAALALVACAQAAAGQVIPRPQCPSNTDCKSFYDPHKFLLKGKEYYFIYVETSKPTELNCALNCAGLQLDDPVWPHFSEPFACYQMKLIGCAPPATSSYMDAVHAFNVTGIQALVLEEVPRTAHVGALALRGVPPSLDLSAVEGGVLELHQGALAAASLTWLRLERVRADALPANIDVLKLIDTDTMVLPPEALTVKELTIQEKKLLTFSGKAKRLNYLSLDASTMETLQLSHTEEGVLLPGFAKWVPRLQELVLEHVPQTIREHFLRGAMQLRSFRAVKCDLTALPKNLFDYSPNLEYIDLSNNKIKTLSVGQFKNLRHLDTLLLTDNELTAKSLIALAPITWLKALGLSGNPLGSLCVPGSPSILWPLQQLKALHLARTKLAHFCNDWLSDMRELADLDLRNNEISTLDCKDLRIGRSHSVHDARIDFTGNSIIYFFCSKWEHRDFLSDLSDTQRATMVLNSPLECKCSSMWFELVAKERRIKLEGPGRPPHCDINVAWTERDCK